LVSWLEEEVLMSSERQRSLSALSATVVTVTVVGLLFWAKSVFIPIALAIFLAFALSPVVSRLQRRGLGRSTAVLLTVGLVLLATVGIGALVTQQVSRLAATLPDRVEAIKAKLIEMKRWASADGDSRFGRMLDDLGEVFIPRHETQQTVVVEREGLSVGSFLGSYVTPAAQYLSQVAFAFVLTIYILIRREDLRNRMIRLIGAGKVTHTTKAVDEATRRISRYLLMQLVVNVLFGLLISLGLSLLGVDYAALWGLIATLSRYVPYVGVWIGMLVPLLFSFATAPGWGQPLLVFALFATLELLCSNVIEPWLYGRTMGLSEVAQLVAAALWAFLWGPIGLILSGPLTACLLVLGKYVRRLSFLEVILGDEPALTPQVAFYQRLAARDQDEAAEVAMSVAKESGPDAALETVIVPALSIARRDLDDGDLDPGDFNFAVHAAREVAAEIGDLREPPTVAHDENRVRVLIVPARDEAEHVAADALGGSLNPTRWEVRVTGDEMLASELIDLTLEFDPAVIVIVALPPGGLSHCRYLVNRLHAKNPSIRVVVARWSWEGEPLSPQSGIAGADGIDHTMSDTRRRLHEIHPVLAAEDEEDRKSRKQHVTVGTPGA
jgi:predicted PurR-regulated permease PerM